MNERSESLGERIRRLRQEKGISQDRLALRAGIDQSGLSKFERGKERRISETSLRRIASVLEIEFEHLVRNTGFSKSGHLDSD
jgi:transcriptional regulator with XRE-family HTH domain